MKECCLQVRWSHVKKRNKSSCVEWTLLHEKLTVKAAGLKYCLPAEADVDWKNRAQCYSEFCQSEKSSISDHPGWFHTKFWYSIRYVFSRNNLYYERPVYIASFVAYLAQSAGKGQKPYQNRVFASPLLFKVSYWTHFQHIDHDKWFYS